MKTLALFGLVLVASCGKEDPQKSQDSLPSVGSAASVGTFQVAVNGPTAASSGFVSVFGKLYDGTTPQPVIWDQTGSSGDCVLLVPRNPYCSTACPSGSICAADEECVAYPAVMEAGTVTASGIETASGADSFTMNPIAGNYQAVEALAYPAFGAGDTIRLEAAGGSGFEAFSVAASGVDELEWTGGTPTLEHGTAVDLAWTAAQAGDSEVHVKLDISHHGGTKGKIECVTADDGSVQLGGALIGQLLDLGYAGFPTVIVTRRSLGSATTTVGRVDLVVSSAVEEEIVIPGLVSCNDDSDCLQDRPTCLLPDRVCI